METVGTFLLLTSYFSLLRLRFRRDLQHNFSSRVMGRRLLKRFNCLGQGQHFSHHRLDLLGFDQPYNFIQLIRIRLH